MSNYLRQLNDAIAATLHDAGRSLVQVHNGRRGAGAGTIWHSDGLILTNAHVVGSRRLTVTLPDGKELPARLLAQDRRRDLAALYVEASGLPTIPIGESRSLQAGQMVLAIGHPWGVRGAVTTGIIIGVGSHWAEIPGRERDLIAASLPLRPGNSGGPLLDVQGRLIGINAMITGPQIAFAIPVHSVKAFLKEMVGARDPVEKAAMAERRGLRPVGERRGAHDVVMCYHQSSSRGWRT